MPPFCDRLIIHFGQFFEGAAEGRFAIGALTFTIAFVIVVAAVVHCRRA